ncbi:MAG: DNA mismatch repair protein MutT [Ponticaulis sp.]|nr:DNA mismatch repair protein MutT [Ponticaulis sp.]|tara:strand:+ start:24588 stop:25178 length:591 start_codon:yes stop_codon:yes gene_type:complete
MTKSKRWTVLNAEKVYENPWISLEHADVIAPTGNKGIYGKVHMKNLAIGILPIDESGWTWLVGQHRYCFDDYSWELPEGGGPRAEAPLESARRELAEEIGREAETYIPILENVQFSNSVTDELGFAYIAHNLRPCAARRDETELLEVRHLPLKQVFDMMDQGKLTDMFTVAMLSRAHYLAHTGQLPEEIARCFLDI